MTSKMHCKSRALAGLALGITAPAALMALPDAADPDLGAPQPLPSLVEDEEVRGKLPGDIHSPKAFAEDSRAHDLAVLQSKRAMEKEQVVLLEGSIHTLHMIKSSVRDAGGMVSGLGAIATDITERERAEARRIIGLCQGGGKRAR